MLAPLTVRRIVSIRQCRMWRLSVLCNSQLLPVVNVIVCDIRAIHAVFLVVCQAADSCHSLNSNDSLESKVGLIPSWLC